MKKTFFLMLIYAISFNNVFAQFNPNAEIPLDPSVRKGTLENGLTYYIKHNKKPENKVEMRLAINAGSVLEDKDQLGLAHFLEHMNFNGTKHFPDNKLVDFLQSLGVKFGQHLNAYTSFDETVYELSVPLDKPENLDKGLLVMEDWAFNALLTDRQIEVERGVVLEELRLGLGPEKRMLDRYLPKLLNGSRYADRLPIGSKKILETFNPKVLRRFHKDWYRPNLMALIIVGDIEVDDVENKIKERFSKYKNPKDERERVSFNLPNNEKAIVAVESEQDASFSMVEFYINNKVNYTPSNRVSEYIEQMVMSICTRLLNNRIQELVDSKDPPFTFGFFQYGTTWVRSKEGLRGFAMTEVGGQKKALEVLLEELERAKKYSFSDSELERAKKELLTRMEKAFNEKDKQESIDKVEEYVRNFLTQEPIPGITWEYNIAKSILPMIPIQAINQIFKQLVSDTNRVYVITGPDKKDIKQPSEDEIIQIAEDVSKRDIKPYEESEQIEQLIVNDPKEGNIVSETKNNVLNTTTLILSNGAKVTYKNTDFKDDEIVFRAISKGGSSILNTEHFNKTKWAFRMLNKAGVNNYEKSQLNQYLSDKIVSIYMRIGSESETLSGSSSKKDLKTMFELIYSNFTSLNFDQEAYDAEIKKQGAFFNNLLSEPGFYFDTEVSKFRNSGNPRFTGIIPLEEDWKNTDFKSAYEIYKQKFADADDFHFFFVGNIDDDTFKTYVKKYIASLPSTKEIENWKDNGFRPSSGDFEKVVKKGKDPKSLVSIIFSGETKYDAKEDMAMQALGKILTIKLVEKLREKEGGVYGVSAYGNLSKIPYGKYSLSIDFPCGPENVDKLVLSSLNELDKIIKFGPEVKDLNKYKEGELNDYRDNLKKNSFWITHLTDTYMEKNSSNSILEFENKLNSLTVKDVKDVANKYAVNNKLIAKLYPEE